MTYSACYLSIRKNSHFVDERDVFLTGEVNHIETDCPISLWPLTYVIQLTFIMIFWEITFWKNDIFYIFCDFFFKYHFSKCLPKVWLFNNISTIDKGTEPLDIICYHIWTLHLLRAVFIIDHSYRFYIHFCLYLFFLLWTLYIVTNWTKCCFWNLKSVVFSCLLSLFFWCSHLFCTIWNTHNSPETIRLWQ